MVSTGQSSSLREAVAAETGSPLQPRGATSQPGAVDSRRTGAAMTSIPIGGPKSEGQGDAKYVEFIDVEKMYGHFHAVRRLNLSIGRGEFLTFLGPSGSGKTTTLNMLAGFERPSQGVITLDGKSVDRLPAYELEGGMVCKSLALSPHKR